MTKAKKLIACASLSAASMGLCGYGTIQQRDCFNEVKNEYGVESFDQLSDKIIDESGCLSVLNTAGLLGTAAGVGYGVAVVLADRNREQISEQVILLTDTI